MRIVTNDHFHKKCSGCDRHHFTLEELVHIGDQEGLGPLYNCVCGSTIFISEEQAQILDKQQEDFEEEARAEYDQFYKEHINWERI